MNLSQTLKVRSNVICREKIVKPSNRKKTPQVAKQILQTQGLQDATFWENKTNTDPTVNRRT